LYVETATDIFETLAVDAKATKAEDTTAVRGDAFEMLALDIKVTKADNAAVRVEDWDWHICKVIEVNYSPKVTQYVDTVQEFSLSW
jgi:hypothetical protein